MENQKNDLLLLNLDNINYLFLIPEFDNNNCYYFNFFISFKNKLINDYLTNLNFNIIRIDSINQIKNLSFLEVKTIFNFENSLFSNNKFDYRFLNTLNIDHEKKKIIINSFSNEYQEKNTINFLNELSKDDNLKLGIKKILSEYLKKPDFNVKYEQLKKISYFFY